MIDMSVYTTHDEAANSQYKCRGIIMENQNKLSINQKNKTVSIELDLGQVELIRNLLREQVSGVLTACEGYPPSDVMPNEFAALGLMDDAVCELSNAFGYYTWEGLDG